jgi:hypothetical protein
METQAYDMNQFLSSAEYSDGMSCKAYVNGFQEMGLIYNDCLIPLLLNH